MSARIRTDDPVADAERVAEDTRPILYYCDECGCPIYGEDSLYEGDYYYEVDDFYVCEDCLRDFMNRRYRKRG